MQKFVKNMEKRFGRYAIPDLINYFIVCYVASTIISLFMPGLYYGFLALDFEKIMHGLEAVYVYSGAGDFVERFFRNGDQYILFCDQDPYLLSVRAFAGKYVGSFPV